MRWLGLALIAFAACAPPHQPQQACYREVHTTFHADPGFTVEESAAIGLAVAEWSVFSGGRVDYSVTFDLTPNTIANAIYRVESNDPRVITRDRESTATYGHKTLVAGWENDGPPQRLWLVVDRVPAAHVKHLAQHELGHAAGLRHRNCPDYDACMHVTDAAALMSPSGGQNSFNETDRVFCQESCLCP